MWLLILKNSFTTKARSTARFSKKYRVREGSHRELFLPCLMLASRQRLSSEMRTRFVAKPQRRGRLPGSPKNTGCERVPTGNYFCRALCLQADNGFRQKCELDLWQSHKGEVDCQVHQKIQGMHEAYPVFFGGTGESRTRVRKPLDTTFSVGS